MSDIASAPAEAAVPEAVAADPVAPPAPINVDNVDHSPKPEIPEAKKPSAREAIEKATAKVNAAESAGERPRDEATGRFTGKEGAEAKPEAKTEAKPAEKPTGKATEADPKTAEPPKAPAKIDPPARFDDAAKKEWDTAPESVRGATSRVVRELEDGINEHLKRWEPLKPFDDLARQHGTSLPDALKRYISFEVALNRDPVDGLTRIAKDKGFDLQDVARKILGAPAGQQQPGQAEPSADQRIIMELRGQLNELRQQLGGVAQHLSQQQTNGLKQSITAFADAHADFDALAPDMTNIIRDAKAQGREITVEAAYEQARQNAERLAASLGYVKQPDNAGVQTPTPAPDPAEAQTLERGQRSITGAPGPGSAAIKRSSSIRDALASAMARAG